MVSHASQRDMILGSGANALSPGHRSVALIPARAGSKRIPNKNVRILAGHPLIAYAISAALESGIFESVIVSTDSPEIAEQASSYGAKVPLLRPAEFASDTSPDIEWIRHLLVWLKDGGSRYNTFCILRPTSPFRQASTIRRAFQQFMHDGKADSLRAVQKCREHPGKMWVLDGTRMRPFIQNPDPGATPWHSTPYQALPQVYVQNASLEIARCEAPLELGTIAGNDIMPFLTEGLEGFDINGPADWLLAESYTSQNPRLLPAVRLKS